MLDFPENFTFDSDRYMYILWCQNIIYLKINTFSKVLNDLIPNTQHLR